MTPKVFTYAQDCGNCILFMFWLMQSPDMLFDKLVWLICKRTNNLASAVTIYNRSY